MSLFQKQKNHLPPASQVSNVFYSPSRAARHFARHFSVRTCLTTSPNSLVPQVESARSRIEPDEYSAASVRGGLLYAVVFLVMALAIPTQTYAQGIGEAGAFAVDFGAQDATAQGTNDTVTGTNSVSLGWGTTSSGDNAVVLFTK